MSRGKNFERILKSALDEVGYCLRLYDMPGFTSNPSDFVFFNGKEFYLIEAKSTQGASLPFTNISDNQWNLMLFAVSRAENLNARVVIWFVDKDITRSFDIKYLDSLRKKGKKSVRYDDENGMVLPSTKRRVYCEYNLIGAKL